MLLFDLVDEEGLHLLPGMSVLLLVCVCVCVWGHQSSKLEKDLFLILHLQNERPSVRKRRRRSQT